MKYVISSILSFWLATFSAWLPAQCPQRIFSEDFDGPSLDLTRWSYQTGDGCDISLCGWGNNELQWYLQDNISITDGKLKITAKRQTMQNRSYTSGRIRTVGKFDFKYGRVEARMKLPVGRGIWPALWMLPTDNTYGIWPQSGEIDLMEYVGHEPNKIFGTLHFGQPWPNNASTSTNFILAQGTFNEDFHDYALEWTDSAIRWYIDGYLYGTKTRTDLGGQRWPFDQKFHLLLNLAVGGNLPGNPDGNTTFPQTFEIDYLHVYDLTGAPYLSGPAKVPHAAQNTTYTLKSVPAGSTITWSVPAQATLVEGQGTPAVKIHWGAQSGPIQATINHPCGDKTFTLQVFVEPDFALETILEDIDTPGKITRTSSTGTFTDNDHTPSFDEFNESHIVGKYVRNGGQLFDVLFYDISEIKDGSAFVLGKKKFYLDIYTNAPIGTQIILQLENKNRANANNYPTGRHSRYTVTTSKQNAWNRLIFDFLDQPDPSTSHQSINQLVLLFAPNTTTGHTYYFDNFSIYGQVTTAAPFITHSPFRIYPNPTADHLYITNEKINITGLRLFTWTGQVMMEQNITPAIQTRLNLSNLNHGSYILQIISAEGKSLNHKIIKASH